MISGEKIAQFISQPQAIEKDDLLELGNLVKKYPYSSSIHLLELKGLALANSINFEEKLKSTAIHAPDRSHLYEFIHSGHHAIEPNQNQDNFKSEATETSESVIPETTINETIDIEVVKIEKTTETAINTSAIEEQIVTNNLDSETISNPLTDNLEEVHQEATIHEIESQKSNVTSELDVDILNKAIDVAFVTSEIAPQDSFEEIALDNLTENPAAEEKIKTELEDHESEKAGNESNDSEIPIIPEEPIDTSNFTFIQWLRYKQEQKSSLAASNQTTAPKKVSELPKKVSIQPVAEKKNEEKTPSNQKSRKNEIDALLDKFMEEEPRISRPVKDFYSPVKSAKKSVEESDDMVTETLAKIHVLQKNYSKAISAYEKLMLLYPEKKTFFASRIEKIREESKKR